MVFLALFASATPELEVRELYASAIEEGAPVRKRVQLRVPAGWNGDDALEHPGSMRLFGPNGEGELLIAVVMSPNALGEHLTFLKNAHPSAAPSPPMAIDVKGIDPQCGERATRFQITGKEVGEMVMIERGGVIVLFAAIVEPNSWAALKPLMEKCYPTVKVVEEPKLRVEKAKKK